MLPFHLDTHASSAQKIPPTSHAKCNIRHGMAAHGSMVLSHRQADGVNGPYVMGYYKRADIPFHRARGNVHHLRHLLLLVSPTWPKRINLITGMIEHEGVGSGPILKNIVPEHTWTTYPERLEAAGVSWLALQTAR